MIENFDDDWASNARRPETEAFKLAEAVVECSDNGMTYEDIDEVVRATLEANKPNG